jgi:DNA-binding transcriptional MerR regulator
VGTLSVSELSARSGVPISTIHHYRQRGLLPPARTVGGGRLRYGDEHVRALRLIRRLRERRGLSLENIAEILPSLLASQQEAFRPAMWDRLLRARASADPTRAALVDAAIVELARRPFDDVTVGDLCVAAGIGKGTFYRSFESKEAVFVAAAHAAAERVATAIATAKSADAVPSALHEALAPVLPVLLELATRASRASSPYLEAAPDVFGRIIAAIDSRAGTPGSGVGTLAEAATDLVMTTFAHVR